MLYSGGYFCQVLEGRQNDIEALYKKIEKDSHHSEINLLSSGAIGERRFSNWGMAFAGIEESMRFDINGVKNSKDELQMEEAGNNIGDVLAWLIQHQEIISTVKNSLSSMKANS